MINPNCLLERWKMSKKISTVTLMILLLAGVWAGCSKPGEEIPSGAYAYTAYDSLQQTIITGWFTTIPDSDSTFTGEWHFSNVGPVRDDAGPQLGDGTLEGNQAGQHISINLNPGWIDNNITLDGTEAGGTISGRWLFSGYAGVTNSGPFTAIKR